MSSEANRIVQKLWSYCTVLRDDGLSYGDNLQALSGAERGAPVGAVLQP
jgi:type I restriction enzyme M protein